MTSSARTSRGFSTRDAQLGTLAELTLKLSGYTNDEQQLFRNVLFDQLYASLPRDPQAKVQIYNAEIAPGGYTNWHCHNGATFFIALQGIFEAEFQEGILVKARAGDVYSEPIARVSSRPQPASRGCVPVYRRLHHGARSRARDERDQQALVARPLASVSPLRRWPRNHETDQRCLDDAEIFVFSCFRGQKHVRHRVKGALAARRSACS